MTKMEAPTNKDWDVCYIYRYTPGHSNGALFQASKRRDSSCVQFE